MSEEIEALWFLLNKDPQVSYAYSSQIFAIYEAAARLEDRVTALEAKINAEKKEAT